MISYDVIIIGGGIVGLATCYHLAQMGAKVLLLTSGPIGGGASASNAGRLQVTEGNLDPLNIQTVRDGIARFDQLEEELETTFEHRRVGHICVIRTQKDWDHWVHRSQVLTNAGIPTQIIDVDAIKELEPNLITEGLLGAAYSLEGAMNPFLYCLAFAKAAKRCGAEIRSHTPVTAIETKGERVVCVRSGEERFSAGVYTIMCGAWTRKVAQLADVDVPVHHTHAQGFITQKLPPVMSTVMGLADFYDIIHESAQAVAVGVGQRANGTLLVTEAVTQTAELHHRTSMWGISGIARNLLGFYPNLSNVLVTHAWGCPTPFTPDSNPLVGWLAPYQNLFIGAGFIQTMTVTPVISAWMARMMLQNQLDVSLDIYSPTRFAAKASASV